MKIHIQYILSPWKKALNKLKQKEQSYKLKSDLKEAFEQVAILQQTNAKSKTLNDFLNEF